MCVSYCGCAYTVVVEGFRIELVGYESAGEKILKLLLQQILFHLVLKADPDAA